MSLIFSVQGPMPESPTPLVGCSQLPDLTNGSENIRFKLNEASWEVGVPRGTLGLMFGGQLVSSQARPHLFLYHHTQGEA